MPTTVIDEKTVERSVDAEFAYKKLIYNESENTWEDINKDEQSDKLDALEIYKEANDDNNIQINILSHKKDAGSGFQATLIEKTDSSGNITKVITIAGMDIWEGKDQTAATSISKGDVPGLQYKAMADFITELIDDHKISKADNITMVGHSLGGTLTQLGLPSFSDYIDNACTFNSPGAAKLTATADQATFWGWDSQTYLHFTEFAFNKNNVGDNGSYILIKPEETLTLPTSDLTGSFYINDGGQSLFLLAA